ncbi:hypothetical protein Bbelb_148540 [Branchiostoma belcheri]|nr:hypothetical protein Bbelb_148540 [Branchiostoma belcheri]
MKLLPLHPRRSASPPPRSASPPQKICFTPVVPLRPRRNSALPHDFRVDCELCRHWGLSRRTGAKQNCAGGVEERRGRSRFFAGAKQNGAGAKQNGGGEEEGPVLPGRDRMAFPLDSHGPRSGVLLGFGAAEVPSFPMEGLGFPNWPQNRDQLYGTTAVPNFSMLQTLNNSGGGGVPIGLPYVNGKENQRPLDGATEDADLLEHVRAKQHAHLMSHMHQLQARQREQQEQLLRQQMEQLARIHQEQEKMKSLLVAQRTGHWGGEVKAHTSPKQRSPPRSKSGLSPTGSRQPLSPSHRPWGSRSPPRSGPGSSPSRPRSTLPDALARASMSPRRLAQSFLPQDDLPEAREAHDHVGPARTQVPVPVPAPDSDLGSVMDDGPPLEMEGVFPLPETASEMEDDQSEAHVQEQGNKGDVKVNTTPPRSPPEDSSNYSQGSGTPEDERPIKPLSAGRPKTFEQLLEEKLHLEESKDTESVDGPKQKATKRPFLRKGQGLARFGLTQNRIAGKTTTPSEEVQENRTTSQTGRSTTQKTSTLSTPPTSSTMRQPKRLITTLKLKPQPVRKSVAVTKERVASQPTVAKEPVNNSDFPPVEKLEDEELKEFELLERMAANTSSFIGSTPARANMYRSQGPPGSLRQPVIKSDEEDQEMNEDGEDVNLEQTLEEGDSDLDQTIKEQPEGGDWEQDEKKEGKRDSPQGTATLAISSDPTCTIHAHDDIAAVSSQALNVDFDDDDSWGDMSNKGLEEDDHDTTLDDSIISGAPPLDTSTPPAKANKPGFSRRQNSPLPDSDEVPAPVSVEPPPTSELVAKLFSKLKPAKPKVSAEQVQELQDELQRREQRWQASLNRMKNQLQAAQNESQELREELRMMEKHRLEAWSKAETKKKDHTTVKAFQKQKVTKETSPNKDEEKMTSEDSDKSPEMSAPPKSQLQSYTIKDRKDKTTKHFPKDEFDSDIDAIPEETPRKIPVAVALEEHPSGVKTSDGPKPRRPLQRKKAVKFAGDGDLSLEDEDSDGVEQLQHADGKMENVLKDGRRVITFNNGTRKEISADGQTLIVTFFNGDIKQIMPDQRVIYYYAEAQTTHTTYPDGLEILQFPNSQMEKHYPDGTKEITFPDQTIKYLFPNGDEESIFQDGTVLRVSKSGDRVFEFANGQREIHTLNYKKREYPDGTVKTVYPDGKQETRYSNGRIRVKDKDGNVIVDKKM